MTELGTAPAAASTTASEDDFDLGLEDYHAQPGATAWYTFRELPGAPRVLTRAVTRRLNPAAANAIQRISNGLGDKTGKVEDEQRRDADARRGFRTIAIDHCITDWSWKNRKGQLITFGPAAVKAVVAQIPDYAFDRYFGWCAEDAHFTPAMTRQEVEQLAEK